MTGHYLCQHCMVFGRGRACWCCGRIDLVRSGPTLDAHVYDWEMEGTVHRSGVNGG